MRTVVEVLFIVVVIALAVLVTRPDHEVYHVSLTTEHGPVWIEVSSAAAPEVCERFVYLAEKGFFDGLKLVRREDRLLLGIDPDESDLEPFEEPRSFRNRKPGTLAYVRNTRAQFVFDLVGDSDYNLVPIGEVVPVGLIEGGATGLDVLARIERESSIVKLQQEKTPAR